MAAKLGLAGFLASLSSPEPLARQLLMSGIISIQCLSGRAIMRCSPATPVEYAPVLLLLSRTESKIVNWLRPALTG